MKSEMNKIIKKGMNIALKSGNPDITTWQEFFLIIITYLSFNRKIDLLSVKPLSMELSKKYNFLMKSFNDDIGQSFDILKCIKDWKTQMIKTLNPILEKIENMKDVINGKRNKSHDAETG